MNRNLKNLLEDTARKLGQKSGVTFGDNDLRLESAAKEMGLLDQIEINYPSREVIEMVDVEYPDPHTPGMLHHAQVERRSRVMMSDSDAELYRTELAQERVFEDLLANPHKVEEYLKRIEAMKNDPGKKVASKSGKGGAKPTTKQAAPKFGGKQDPGKKVSGGAKKSSTKKPVK